VLSTWDPTPTPAPYSCPVPGRPQLNSLPGSLHTPSLPAPLLPLPLLTSLSLPALYLALSTTGLMPPACLMARTRPRAFHAPAPGPLLHATNAARSRHRRKGAWPYLTCCKQIFCYSSAALSHCARIPSAHAARCLLALCLWLPILFVVVYSLTAHGINTRLLRSSTPLLRAHTTHSPLYPTHASPIPHAAHNCSGPAHIQRLCARTPYRWREPHTRGTVRRGRTSGGTTGRFMDDTLHSTRYHQGFLSFLRARPHPHPPPDVPHLLQGHKQMCSQTIHVALGPVLVLVPLASCVDSFCSPFTGSCWHTHTHLAHTRCTRTRTRRTPAPHHTPHTPTYLFSHTGLGSGLSLAHAGGMGAERTLGRFAVSPFAISDDCRRGCLVFFFCMLADRADVWDRLAWALSLLTLSLSSLPDLKDFLRTTVDNVLPNVPGIPMPVCSMRHKVANSSYCGFAHHANRLSTPSAMKQHAHLPSR